MNSLLHGFEGSGSGAIRIEVCEENETLHLLYADNGKGIAADHLPKIFHPFFTRSATKSGSGLGMFIVYNLVVQKLHGSIRCESEPGRGVTFYLDMPKNAPEVSNSPDAGAKSSTLEREA
jgi:signal transduction histidine kinase